jgi:hypothetical protein
MRASLSITLEIVVSEKKISFASQNETKGGINGSHGKFRYF